MVGGIELAWEREVQRFGYDAWKPSEDLREGERIILEWKETGWKKSGLDSYISGQGSFESSCEHLKPGPHLYILSAVT